MKAKQVARSTRRKPTQARAKLTVDAILDAVLRLLKREGHKAMTTNRIAEAAGVSIGSVYQYFPNKRAIFISLHERHLSEIDRTVQSKLAEHAASPLDVLIRAMVDAMIEAHAPDPELYEMLQTEVPHRAGGSRDFALRLEGAFRLALSSHRDEVTTTADLETMVFIVANMVDGLSHSALLRRPRSLSLPKAKAAVTQAILAYLTRDSDRESFSQP
jgi:AcrR family transcriptional regulator